MTALFLILGGVLTAWGLALMLGRTPTSMLFGFLFASHGVNALIFSGGQLVAGKPTLIDAPATALSSNTSDPLPQALVLTAIVIGFAVTLYLASLRRHIRDEDQL